jgi:hypothetical protein
VRANPNLGQQRLANAGGTQDRETKIQRLPLAAGSQNWVGIVLADASCTNP